MLRNSKWPHRLLRVVFVFGVLLLAGCGTASPAAPQANPTSRATSSAQLPPKVTVAYCSPGGEPLTLDLFKHRRGGARPVAVFFHGGSFEKGSSTLEPRGLPAAIAASLYAKGFVIASVNYRLAPQFTWPTMIVDAKCAVRYLRAHARALRIDRSRIAVIGNSAGGLLASLLGTSGGPSAAWDQGSYRRRSSAVQAVVDLWGPTDLATLPSRDKQAIETVFGPESPAWGEASPAQRVTAGDPPFFIVQGAQDTTVPPSQATELRDALVAAGVPVVLQLVENAGHDLEPVNGTPQPSATQLTAAIVSFLHKRLR